MPVIVVSNRTVPGASVSMTKWRTELDPGTLTVMSGVSGPVGNVAV